MAGVYRRTAPTRAITSRSPELGKMGDKAYMSNLRVEGFVQPGSIETEGPHVTFVLNEFESHNRECAEGAKADGYL